MTPTAAMIFAAGYGTRMAPLTDTMPKALVAVNGRPLIDYALALTDQAGIKNRVVNTHHFADQMQAHLENVPNVSISYEKTAPLETGGGLKYAQPLLGEGPVFTLNSDAVWTGRNPLTSLSKSWRPTNMHALLLLVSADTIDGYQGNGDFSMDAQYRLSRDVAPGAKRYVFTGAQIIDISSLDGISKSVFSLNDVWNTMIAQGRLFGSIHTGGWVDVGTPAGIARAEELLARQHDV